MYMYHHTHIPQQNQGVYYIFVPTSIVFLHLLFYIFNRKLNLIPESVSFLLHCCGLLLNKQLKKYILIKKFHYDTMELNGSFTVKAIFIPPTVEFANNC